jgi:hypothetical protein
VNGFPIRTPDQRLRVFISSTLAELAEERAAIRDAIERLHLAPVMFELGARPYPPRDLYRAYLAQSQIFIGVYWQRYGWVAPGETVSGLEDEYRLSQGMPRLLYVRSPAPEREPRLERLLRQIQEDDTASYRPFRTPDELAQLVGADLALLLSEHFTRPGLPTGVVTFLAIAVDDAEPATDKADTFFRQIVSAHRGFPVNAIGGALCAAFAQPADAVSAAADLRRTAVGDLPGAIRMAMHSAAVDVAGDGYRNPPRRRLSQLLAAGHGGQALLSAAVVDLLDRAPAPPLALRSLGLHQLSDTARAEEIHQLDVDGLPATFPPPRTLHRRRHNLPVQLSSFVGREHELSAVKNALRDGRLATLTGIGGCGKSRLALETAAALVDEFRDGVFLVDLAPLTEPDRVPSAVASVLGVGEQPQRPLIQTLTEHVRDKNVLIVLDNCEHLLAACAEFTAAVLPAADGVRVC